MTVNTGSLFGASDRHLERSDGLPGGVPEMKGPGHQHEALVFDALLGEPITGANATSEDEGPVSADVARQAQQADTVMRASSQS